MLVYLVTDGDAIEGTYTTMVEARKHCEELNKGVFGNLFTVTSLFVSEKYEG